MFNSVDEEFKVPAFSTHQDIQGSSEYGCILGLNYCYSTFSGSFWHATLWGGECKQIYVSIYSFNVSFVHF